MKHLIWILIVVYVTSDLSAQTKPPVNESNVEHIFDSIRNSTNWDKPEDVEKAKEKFKEKMLGNTLNDPMQQKYDGIIGEEAALRVRQEMNTFFEAENDTLNPDSEYLQLLSYLIINMDNPESRSNLDGLEKYSNLQTLLVRGNYSAVKIDINTMIGQLQSLPVYNLYITNNKTGLNTIPESIGNLKNLNILGLFGNTISELPESIGALSLLEELYLDGNPISSLPSSIGKLKKLKILGIAKTNISVTERIKIQALLPDCKILLQ